MKANKRSFNKGIKDIIYSKRENYPSIYLSSGGELSVYKCCGLVEYSETCVKINTELGALAIYGKELGLNTFSNSEITVFGKIYKIEFEEEAK